MKFKRKSSFINNMSMSVIARIVTLITGVIVQRYILLAYGSAINGLTSSIAQIMSYLVLLEAGLGTASIQALYSPLAKNDWNKISGIFTATEREYRKISFIFVLILLVASVVLPFTVSEEVEYKVAGMLTFITGLSNVVSYIFGGKYKAVLSADRKMYVLYALEILSNVISCVFRVVALNAGAGIILVQMIHLASIGIKNAGYIVYVKAKYKNINYGMAPDISAIGKRWNVMIHNIAGIIVNNTDIMILTIFSSLKMVSIYSVYNLVFGQISSAIQTTFIQAAQGTFGMLYNRDKKEFEYILGIFETLFTIFLFLISAIAIIMVLPFVTVYTGGVSDMNYIDKRLPVLFTIILIMNQIRVPSLIAINVTGSFKETQTGAILESVINLTVSLALFWFTKLGLYGLLVGTICSYLFRTVDVIVYTYRYLLDRKVIKMLRTVTINFIILLVLYIAFCIIIPLETVNFIDWIWKSCIVIIISTVIFGVGNWIFNYKELQVAMMFLKLHVKK